MSCYFQFVTVALCAFTAPIVAKADWFEDLANEQVAEVTRRYPPMKDMPGWSLLEFCGGVGRHDDPTSPGACAAGVMNALKDIKYLRLVLTPLKYTAPVVLAFYNRTANSTTYEHSSQFWAGDNQVYTDWSQSSSLDKAYSAFAAFTGGSFVYFAWRAMLARCVFEPVFEFTTANYSKAYVGAYARKVCGTPVMMENATIACQTHCYNNFSTVTRNLIV